MTRQEAEAIYDAGKKTVVRVLMMMDALTRLFGGNPFVPAFDTS